MNHFANNGKEYLRKKSSVEDDITYRQGRSKKQVEGTEAAMQITIIAGAIFIVSLIIYNLFTS